MKTVSSFGFRVASQSDQETTGRLLHLRCSEADGRLVERLFLQPLTSGHRPNDSQLAVPTRSVLR